MIALREAQKPGRPRTHYRVTLRVLDSPIRAEIRLRQFLKFALRHWDFKCVELQEVKEDYP